MLICSAPSRLPAPSDASPHFFFYSGCSHFNLAQRHLNFISDTPFTAQSTFNVLYLWLQVFVFCLPPHLTYTLQDTPKLFFLKYWSDHITVQFNCSVVSDSLQPHGMQYDRLLCPSPIPGACSDSCPLSQWCHPTISSSVVAFSSCLKSFPASGSFPISQFFASDDQSIGASASASVLPIQGWYSLGLTD